MRPVKPLCRVSVLAGLAASTSAFAMTISGTVRDASGSPQEHVFVTADNSDRKMAVVVLTDEKGHYAISDLVPGTYELQARKVGFSDGILAKTSLTEAGGTYDLALKPEDGTHFATPGSAWLTPLPDVPMKAKFIASCAICHDISSPLVRVSRDADTWTKTIERMRSKNDIYSIMIQMDPHELGSWLASVNFGGKADFFDPFRKSVNAITGARIDEYEVGDVTSWAHDLIVSPRTGLAYVGDYVKDVLISIDPATGKQKTYPAPVHNAGMHTLDFDRDGFLWITFQLADKVARFDPKTAEWRVFSGLRTGTQVHSFALDPEGLIKKDARGRLYVSQFHGNCMSMLDPSTGAFQEVGLPGAAADKPYGIAVDSKGRVWYNKYSNNKVGYVDPGTGHGEEWTLPRPDSAPHRMTIDTHDNLWMPLSGYGTLLRYSTVDRSMKEFKLPDPDTFPYYARYDAKSDRVWVTGNGGNAIYSIDPETGDATTYRLPVHSSYGRTISINPSNGDVWTALASYPNQLAMRKYSVVIRIENAVEFARH